ncbi:MAG TPA: fibronectin type III domain-containing protein, partial [Acidimicrobiales bacterium]
TNNVEGVRVAAPAPGRYQVTVRAANVAQGRQGYALAVSGRLATDTTRIVFDAPKYKPGAKATAYLLGTTLSGDTVDGFTRLGPSVYRREITASGPSVVAEAAGARATAPVDSTSPVASGAQVESVSADLARVTWTSDEPSSAELVVSGGGAETTFPDAYNPSSFPGLETPVLENKGVYLNRKVVSPQHEVNVTGLKPGTTYTYTVRSTDEAGNTGDGPTGTFTSTEGMYAPKANDMAMLLSGETTAGLPTTDLPAVGGQGWGTSTQLYAGYLEPLPTQLEPGLGGTPTGRVEAIPAFMFRLPGSIDPKRITGAAVEMFSAHDIHDTYTAETTYSLDLLDSSAESGWGPGKTFASVKGAAADVQMAPDPTLRRGANVKYAWQVPCNELTKFQENLSEDGTTEKRAAFRLQGLSEANESLFSFEAGFNRRSRGPQLRPRLVLFLDGLDPQPCTASAAPEISNVLVDHTDTTSAVVSWQTDVPSDSTVYYRKVGEAAWTPVSAPVRVTQHFVRVAGLTNNGTYEFVVRSATCNGLASVDDNGGKSYAMYNAAFVPPKLNGIHSVPSTATANTQIVSWTTDQEADTIVRYGTSPTALNTEIKQTTRSGEHTVSLPNLVACTRYYFTVTSTNSAGKAATSEVLAFDRAPTNLPTTVASYDFESGEQGWTNDPAAGTGNTGTPVGVGVATGKTLWQRRTAETGSQAMRTIVKETGAPGYTSNADQRLVSPAITVPSTGHTAVEWTEWHNFEGVADIEAYDNPTVQVTMPDGTVYTLRSAVTSQNPDFPDATTVRIGLPHETAGQTVRVTFRLKSDAAVETPGGGWAVDNVKVLNGSCATLAGVVAGVPLAPTAPPPNLTTTAQSVTVGPVPPVAASGAAIGELPTLVGAPSAASVAAGTCRCGDVRYLGQAVAATGGGTGGGPAPSVAAGAPTGTLPATGGSPGLFGLVALALLWAAMALRRRLSG